MASFSAKGSMYLPAQNPRFERTGGRPIWHAGTFVAAGRSSATRYCRRVLECHGKE